MKKKNNRIISLQFLLYNIKPSLHRREFSIKKDEPKNSFRLIRNHFYILDTKSSL